MADPEPPPCGPDRPPLPDGEPPPFRDEWRTETVVALALGIRDVHAFDRLPILADALEEAGCDDWPLLTHCRSCPRHEPDCWAVERVLPSDRVLWSEAVRRRMATAVARAVQQGNQFTPRPPTPMFQVRNFDQSIVGRLALLAGLLVALVLLVVLALFYFKVLTGKP